MGRIEAHIALESSVLILALFGTGTVYPTYFLPPTTYL